MILDKPKIALYRTYDTSTGELGEPEPGPPRESWGKPGSWVKPKPFRLKKGYRFTRKLGDR